jgi:hypothetical protein
MLQGQSISDANDMNLRNRLALPRLRVVFARDATTRADAVREQRQSGIPESVAQPAPLVSLRQAALAALMFAGVAPSFAGTAAPAPKDPARTADNGRHRLDASHQAEMMDSVLVDEPYQAPRGKRPARTGTKAGGKRSAVAQHHPAHGGGFNVHAAKIRAAGGNGMPATRLATNGNRNRSGVAAAEQGARSQDMVSMRAPATVSIDADPRPLPIFDDWTSAASLAESANAGRDARAAVVSDGVGQSMRDAAPLAAGVTGARLTERVVQAPAIADAGSMSKSVAVGRASGNRTLPMLQGTAATRNAPPDGESAADPWASAWFGRSGLMHGSASGDARSVARENPQDAAKPFDATLLTAPRNDSSGDDWTRVSEVRSDASSMNQRGVW